MCERATCTVTERFFGMLGMARRAGKTVHGTDMICERMRARSKPVLVIASHEASERTRLRLQYKCEFYNVPFLVAEVTAQRLGQLCGCSVVAAVAVTDAGLAQELQRECK